LELAMKINTGLALLLLIRCGRTTSTADVESAGGAVMEWGTVRPLRRKEYGPQTYGVKINVAGPARHNLEKLRCTLTI
jgi:hypothetical protein